MGFEVGSLVFGAAVVLHFAARASLEIVVPAAVAAAWAEGLGFGVFGHFGGEGVVPVGIHHE